MIETNKKLGKLLKVERERQDISLEDLSTRLKISESNLVSIEEGKASDLPSELYFDLFSRSYCQAMGIDHARTLEAISIEQEEQAEAEALAKKGGGDKGRSGEQGESSEASGADSTRNIKRLGMIFGSIIVLFIGFMLTNKFIFDSSAPETSADGEGASSAEETKNLESEIRLADYQWGEIQNSAREPMKLRLTAIDSSWATILADGDTVIFRKLRLGRIYDVEAKYRLQISIGIPRAVIIELNGAEVKLVDPESRRISRVRINQMNLESFLNSALPSAENNSPEVGVKVSPVKRQVSVKSETTG